MKSIYYLVLYATIIEIIMIVLIVLITVIVKFFSDSRNKQQITTRSEIEQFIMKRMKSHSQINPSSFDDRWKKINLLLPIIAYFDKYHSDTQWLGLRANFIRNIVLPLARTAAESDDWTMRHYAAEAFTLFSENSDEKYILKLIGDPIPLVRYSAAAAGIIYGSQITFQGLIKQMSNESWLTQTMYMQGFDNIPSATHYLIERLLKSSTDSAMRATCYYLLLKYPVFVSDWDIAKDTESKDMKLALVATQYLAYTHKGSAIEVLIKLLDHSDWRMRAVAISCLGDLKVNSAISYVSKMTDDNNWWVRFSARQALQKFGDAGKHELALKNINESEMNIDISRQVLNTF